MARPDRHRNMVLATDALPLDTSNLRYDYSQIQDEHRQQIMEAAVNIQRQATRAGESIINIGKHLLFVKDLLPHGQFSAWIETEFDLSQRMATNMMAAAREYGDKSETVSILSSSALYLLSAPSTSPEVREVVEKQAISTGRSPTRAEIKRIKREMEPQPLPPAKVVYVEPNEEIKLTAKDLVATTLTESPTVEGFVNLILREEEIAKRMTVGDGIEREPYPLLGHPVTPPAPRVTRAESLRQMLQQALSAAEREYRNLTGMEEHVERLGRAIAPMIENLNDIIMTRTLNDPAEPTLGNEDES